MKKYTHSITFQGRQFSVEIKSEERLVFWKRMASGEWEPSTFDVFNRFLSNKTVAFDIGAWIGATTLYMAARADRVIALEPDPSAFEELSGNLELNSGVKNVKAHQACIGIAPGTVRLNMASAPGDSMSSIVGLSNGPGWDVKSVTMHELLKDVALDAPLFLKVDVEGYEYRVLCSLLDALAGRPFVIFLSTHPEFAIGMREAKGAFRRLMRKILMAWVNLKLAVQLRGCDIEDSNGRPVRTFWAALNVAGTKSFTDDRTIVIKPKS